MQQYREFWNWESTLDEVTGGRVEIEDVVDEWPVWRFYNKLAQLKDKNKAIEEELAIEKMRRGIN